MNEIYHLYSKKKTNKLIDENSKISDITDIENAPTSSSNLLNAEGE